MTLPRGDMLLAPLTDRSIDRERPTVATLREAVIVDAVRSPIGRRAGALAGTRPDDLAAAVIAALVERTGVEDAGASRRPGE
jgi:hypothetical protein